jgi:very-short-patch-repair endonuclease
LPSVMLPRDALEARVALGIPLERIAKEMGTTPFLVERNIQTYGLQKLGNAPLKARVLTEFQLKKLEAACPGLQAAFSTYSGDKETFFRKAYQAYTTLLQQAWFLKDMCQMPFSRLKEDQGGMEEISWSMNRHELALSQELISHGIPHFREFVYSGSRRADFGLIGTNILVEIDGEYHTDEKNKDYTAHAVQLGYRVLRFSTRQVQFKMSSVVAEIQASLKKSCSGGTLVPRRCGTSKSKATTAT